MYRRGELIPIGKNEFIEETVRERAEKGNNHNGTEEIRSQRSTRSLSESVILDQEMQGL